MGCNFSQVFPSLRRAGPKRQRLSFGSEFNQGLDAETLAREETGDFDGYVTHPGKTSKVDTTTGQGKMLSKKKSASLSKTLSTESNSKCVSLEDAAEVAVRNRNKEQLLRLINKCGDGFVIIPASSLPKKKNPVELACSLGYYDLVEVFLDHGCSPNLPTSAGKLLHSLLESMKSHADNLGPAHKVLKTLCEKGCDLNIKDYKGNTPLMHCAQIGDSGVMNDVLSKCSELQLSCRCSGSLYTPLHMSAMRGDFECVKLLLSRSPHKHVDVTDKYGNTALHLALKSMLHNIPYLNAAKESLEISGETSSHHSAACEQLMRFQHNAVAIVEALVIAGANVHATCCPPSAMDFQYYPLIYALQLCAEDETGGFEFDRDRLSSTLNLVSQQTIQSLKELGKSAGDESCDPYRYRFSPYAGVVRLLVLAGTEVSLSMRGELYKRFSVVSVLLDEVCEFWDRYKMEKPPKLVHIAKLKIRSYLASIRQLHEISHLPLPPRLKEYVKLNYL
ncbi:hypothetical protein BaRGS_00010722 [Batillaria attramentaria]|uniref:SOCS box domain-containing protein n=1 Tax=Batillaria attramentaria TaxID=370345 RepID=A0ABD0LEY2_9CAEN